MTDEDGFDGEVEGSYSDAVAAAAAPIFSRPSTADPSALGHDPKYELMLLAAKDVERYTLKIEAFLDRERQLKEAEDEDVRLKKQRERNIKFNIPEDIDDENASVDVAVEGLETPEEPVLLIDYSKEYTAIEKVEIFETGGIAAFFMGNYKASEAHLSRASTFLQKMLGGSSKAGGDGDSHIRHIFSVLRVNMYLALTLYRCGNNVSAEKYMTDAISHANNFLTNCSKDGSSSSSNSNAVEVNRLLAMCYSNYSLIKYSSIDTTDAAPPSSSQHIVRDSIDKGRMGVELAAKLYGGTSSPHQQYLNHVRSLLSLYLKTGDLAKAEALIDDTKFPPSEQSVLRAGVRFLAGKYESALLILRKSHKENSSSGSSSSGNSDEAIVSRWKNDIFESLNLYNMNVFRVCNSDHSKNVTVQTMDKLVLILQNIIVENKTLGVEQGNLVSLMDKCSDDTFPNYYCYDNYLFLVAFLAHAFMAKIEMLLLSNKSEDAENLHKLTLFVNNAPKNKYDESFDVNEKSRELLTGMRDSVLKIGDLVGEIMSETNNNNLLLERHSIQERLRMIGHLSNMASVTNNYSYEMESDLSAIYSLRLSEILRSQFGYNLNDKTAQRLLLGTKERPTRIITADSYQGNKHDKFTVSSEIFQVVSTLGNDERSVLVQWALCQGGGVGLGFMGTPSPPTGEESGLVQNGSNLTNVAKKMADSYLKEVRLRLIEADNDLVAKFDASGMKYAYGEREMRIILNILIVKLAAQCGSKKDCESYLREAEMLVQMYRPNCKEHDKCDFFNIAVVKRMRIDLEEWNLSMLVNGETRLNALIVMLNISKDYLAAALKSADSVMVRDAFRRTVNLYIDIHNAPYSSPTFSLGTNEKLSLYSEDDINERERNNVEFVKSFAKLRAQVLLSRFKMYFKDGGAAPAPLITGASGGLRKAASLANIVGTIIATV